MARKTVIERVEATKDELVEAAGRTLSYEYDETQALEAIKNITSVEELVNFAKRKLAHEMDENEALGKLEQILNKKFIKSTEEVEGEEALYVSENISVQDDADID